MMSSNHPYSGGSRVVSRDDAQMQRDMRYFAGELLKHADTLPADLAEMLRDYESELRDSPPGRWTGTGDLVQGDCLAHRIGQSVTDGEWREGERLDSPGNRRQGRGAWQFHEGTAAARGTRRDSHERRHVPHEAAR